MVDPGKVVAEALTLGRDERAAIAMELLESLDGDPEADPEADPDPDVALAWSTEIESRVEEVRDGRVKGDALQDAIAELDEIVAR